MTLTIFGTVVVTAVTAVLTVVFFRRAYLQGVHKALRGRAEMEIKLKLNNQKKR